MYYDFPMKRALFSILAVLLLIQVSGCSKRNKQTNIQENTSIFEISDSDTDLNDPENQLWHATNRKIYVIFGYNYNIPSFIEETTTLLSKNYGLSEDGGIIIPVVFPDGFRHKDKAVSTDLFNILDTPSVETAGIVILGAPENTHKALVKLQDQWQGEIPFPVISLFPQDDTLGIEDTSTIVIDKLQKAEMDSSMITESEQQTVSDGAELVSSVVNYILKMDNAPSKDEYLGLHAKQMLPGRSVRRYSDSETGLYSINHFVIE